MTKPDDKDLASEWKNYALEKFNEAGAGLKSAKDELKANAQEASNELRDTINMGRDAAHDAYIYVEKTVGKDRIAGALVGAKIGGTAGLPGGVVGATLGGAVGTAIGFAAGRALFRWLDAGRSNDNPGSNDPAPPAAPDKPDDPAP